MRVYYKGLLYKADEIRFKKYIEIGEPAFKLFSKTKIDYISLNWIEEFLTEYEKNVLKKFLIKENSRFSDSYFVTDENIKKILNVIIEGFENKYPEGFKQERIYNYSKEKYIDVEPIEIIIELFKDNYGNLYGKEIISNKVFQIFNENTRKINPNYKIIKFRNRDSLSLSSVRYNLCYEWELNYPNVLQNGAMIFNQQYATLNEVEIYLNKFRGIGNTNGIKFIELLTNLSKNVTFSSDFQIEKVLETFDLDVDTIIKNIEYLLLKIEEVDEKIYLEYKSRYDEVIDKKTSKIFSKSNKINWY